MIFVKVDACTNIISEAQYPALRIVQRIYMCKVNN